MTNEELLALIDKAAEEQWDTLDLSGNELTELPSEIGKLTKLKTLILGKWDKKKVKLIGNNLTSLPPKIVQLSSLQTLSLKYNKLSNLPLEIGQLSSLKTLDLSDNQLSSLPSEIGQLSSLQTLSLRNNQLSSLPAEIGQLSSLQTLSLRNNQLSSLPSEIGQLSSLQTLSLGNNQLSSLPAEIGQLSSLQTLSLDKNQLSSLPSEIGQLSSLQRLALDKNQLSSLPAEIGQLSSLQTLSPSYNPLEKPPLEIIEQGIEAIRDYFRDLKEGVDTIYEAKLLIVGEGESGKTSLMNKILDHNYKVPQPEEATHGIQIRTFQFPLSNDQKFKVNIWDFGGQEVYHQTHQFFLTKRSLYALVADSRKDHPHLDYWLHIVKLLSDDSPLVIIKNEKNNYSVEIQGESQILDIFYPMVKEILATNLADNRNLDKIIEAFKYHINRLPQVGINIPKSWANVRQTIEQDNRDYISLDEYLELCDRHQYNQSTSFDDNDKNSTIMDSRLRLSQFFHDLGIILHFQDDEASLLYDTVILNPEWGTQAVYALLKRENNPIKNKFGKFTYGDLKTIWSDERYKGKYRELLELMKRFKLCYELPGKNYIAPQLLEDKKPTYTWDNKHNLKLRYHYDFMPKGILSRFIVEMNSYIDEPNVWRSGVVFKKENTYAAVIETYNNREIEIKLRGDNKRGLLEVITTKLDEIHSSYHNLKVDKLIPCNCDTCINSQNPYFHRLENLRNLLSKNRQESQCQISGDMVNIYSLIDDTIGRKTIMTQESKYNLNLEGATIYGFAPESKDSNVVSGEKVKDNIIANTINETPQQDLPEAAAQIQALLEQLSQTYPTETKKEKRIFAAEAMDVIEQDSSLTQRLLSAAKAGSLAAIESMLNHPAASFIIAAIEDLNEE